MEAVQTKTSISLPRRRRLGKESLVLKILPHLLLIPICLLFLLPFIWMILTSCKPSAEIFIYPIVWFPQDWSFDSYISLFSPRIDFLKAFWNTTIIASLNIVGALLSCSMGAYAFARLRFPGRDALFLIVLATMMIPVHVTVIPTYLMMRYVGWLDTFLPLVVPGFLGGAFGIFLLRQFFATIPRELEEAAIIDGCSRLTIFWRIILPLAKPALVSLALFVLVFQWNDLLRPMVFLQTTVKMPLSYMIVSLIGQYTTAYNVLMAAAFLSILPIIVVYVLLQRYFIQGVAMTGLKG